MRVGLCRLAPSNPSFGLGGFTLSLNNFQDIRQHGPRTRVDSLDTPCGEFVAHAALHVASRGPNWVLPVNACANDSLAGSVYAVPAAP